MGYTFKATIDTWLKLSTAQGSTLPDDQRQFLKSGTILPLSGFELAGTDHLKVTLGKDQSGKQIQFKGRNTWYVYRPAIQVLRDDQKIDLPAVRGYGLKAVIDTWLKLSTAQGSTLPDDQRQFFKAGTVLPLAGVTLVGSDHLKVTLGKNDQGGQVQFKGRNTWYVYQSAVQVLQNGQPINISPSPGNTVRQINAKGLRLIKSFEGLRLEAYLDAVGVWTIGYGTTRGVQPGMKITQAQAEQFLMQDLETFETAVTDLVNVPLNDDQFSALVSFTYNVGEGAFAGSTLLTLLNQRNYQGAADQFLLWNKGNGGVELAGLTRRRKAERSLFLGQDFTVYL
jgi:GH24 family phage-related lysozyme (muramidase)